MKTEMTIKTDGRSLFGEEKRKSAFAQNKSERNRLSVFLRGASCVSLLALLAVCGYVGAGRETAQTTAAPITQRTSLEDDVCAMTFEEAKAQYESDRRQELALLESVTDHPQTDDQTRQSALEQKTQIASRMEEEAQIRAALTHMGFEEVAAICGAQMITLIMPQKYAGDDAQTVRIIDAVTSLTGVSAQDVKIILVKK